jgi:redox-sensitive bicupin YhaK (pirin superfamily)
MQLDDSIPASDLQQTVVPRLRDLGDGFTVRRVLPAAARRAVGPFVFFDQMGPADLPRGRGLDVRPHPHIGLATVTYLFEGEMVHRDSLGTTQVIRPGEVNWMIAGRGIVHSERTPPETRAAPSKLSGIQAWIGLPRREEQASPQFTHHAIAELPQLEHAGVRVRLIAGTLQGMRSPVPVLSPLFYAEAQLQPGAQLELDDEHHDRAIYVTAGTIEMQQQSFEAGSMLVFQPGRLVRVRAGMSARVMLLGGAPLDGPRYVWWNFVSSDLERMQRAADDWQLGRFERVPGDDEFIPLPDTRPPRVAAAAAPRPADYP